MFQNKNNQTTDGGQTILSQAQDLPLEDLPVHTMKKDLEAIKHPELAKETEDRESVTSPRPVNREKLTEAQKSSPFLDFSAPKKAAPEEVETRPEPVKTETVDSRIKFTESTPAPKPEKTEVPQNLPISNSEKPIFDPEKNSPEPKQHPHHINFNKVFAGVAAVLIIAIAAGGGYYFWITRQSTPEVVVTPPITEPEPEPVAKFSIDKPNNIKIDITTATSATIRELLLNTAKDVSAEKTTLPVELNITGTDGKLIPFKDFIKLSGITLSPALAANLSDTFSLFIYNDNAVTRGGLAIDSKDPVKLKGLLALEEKPLIKNIASAFPVSKPALVGKIFASSNYNGTAIRYMNITSPEDWSVDYAIYNNKLVMGTTKMTLRSVIDYLKPELK